MNSFLKKLLPFRRSPVGDRFHVKVITTPDELLQSDALPMELRFVLAVRPSRFEVLRQLLERGFGVGVRIVDKTPERVLKAVDRISHETQENTVVPWLEHLLRREEIPVFSKEELEQCETKGINLYEEVKAILEQRFEFAKIILMDLHNQGIGESEQQLMREMNEDLYPMAIDLIVHRVIFDNAHTRTEVAQSIVKALIFIGPIAHVLEHVISGLGKIFAASADDLLSETAELFALRGSGFTWRQLAKRGRILVPVFALATYGAFQVEPLVQSGHVAWAGMVFGLSAVALSLTTALQSIGMYRQAYSHLVAKSKLQLVAGMSLSKLALRQDFTNPARLGLFVGAAASPIIAALAFTFFSELISNGWVLALLGSVESVVAGITVIGAGKFERMLFRSRMQGKIRERIS